MDLFADISAIQNRIAEISGIPAPDAAPAPGAFNAALAQALAAPPTSMAARAFPSAFPPQIYPSPSFSGAAGPAPVAPADIDALVQQNAASSGVDPALIKSVIANESAYDAGATSNVGAQGLMQLMPETAAELGVADAYDPAQNVAGGTRYLRQLLDRFDGNTRLAVAAYNAGPAAVEKYGDVPPYAETQSYVHNVLASYDRYRNP
jgi:soluble lytic murein transglycosylase-like protein